MRELRLDNLISAVESLKNLLDLVGKTVNHRFVSKLMSRVQITSCYCDILNWVVDVEDVVEPRHVATIKSRLNKF